MASNEVRIIGGKWKGRKLRFPGSAGLRPTLGRARETLFNWLAPTIHGTKCLDLYAGSGALGLEALSRGAAEVVFVEHDPKAASALKSNVMLLDAEARVILASAVRFLRTATDRWDIIFLDPPFESRDLTAVLELIADRELLAGGGYVYVERSKKEVWTPGSCGWPGSRGWELTKHAHAGDSQFGLLARK